jgi:hypothetical protein
VILDRFINRSYMSSAERKAMPSDEVFVYPRTGVTTAQWGPFYTKEWDEPGAWNWHVMGKAEIGMVCATDVWRSSADLVVGAHQ